MSKRMRIFAHRGARRQAPENTLPAFARAIELGADGIELDVHASKDGQLVVIHNFSVDKTTDRRGRVERFTAAQLSQMDAGSRFAPEFAGTGIPSLEQVFDLVAGRCQINVEIKSNNPNGGEEVDLVAALIQRRGCYDQVIVSSFNPVTLIRMRVTEPKIALGLLYYLPMPQLLLQAWFSSMLQPQALHPYYPLVDVELADFAHRRGCAINTWTINELADAQRLAALGVDTIITDVPDQMMLL